MIKKKIRRIQKNWPGVLLLSRGKINIGLEEDFPFQRNSYSYDNLNFPLSLLLVTKVNEKVVFDYTIHTILSIMTAISSSVIL